MGCDAGDLIDLVQDKVQWRSLYTDGNESPGYSNVSYLLVN